MCGIFSKTKKLIKPNIIFLHCFKNVISRFYGLPKPHKVSVPLRRIKSPSYNLSKFLSRICLAYHSRKLGRAFWVGFGLNFYENFGLTSGPIRCLQRNFQKTKLFCYLILTLCKLT